MKIRHKSNGGLAEVSDEYGAVLVAAGAWEALEAPKPADAKQPPRGTRKAAQKIAEAQKPAE